jgi:hypothetical protein
MSVSFGARLPSLTILNGQSNSNILRAKEIDDASIIILYAPAALDAFTFTIEVSDDPDAISPVWNTLQLGDTPADATAPPATKARAYYEIVGAGGFRVHSSSAVAADRIWRVTKQFIAN